MGLAAMPADDVNCGITLTPTSIVQQELRRISDAPSGGSPGDVDIAFILLVREASKILSVPEQARSAGAHALLAQNPIKTGLCEVASSAPCGICNEVIAHVAE